MLRLAKYIKPYLLLVLLAIVLLFIQANAELALPDYMSRIVNNGIQQGGVEDAAPQALRQSTLDHMFLFMNPEDQATALEYYSLVDAESADYAEMLETYPLLESEAVYVLEDISSAEREELNQIMAGPLIAVYGIQQMLDDPESAEQMSGMGMDFEFDLSMIPEGMDVFELMKMMPPAQLEGLTAQMDKQFEVLGSSMVEQMAVGFVKMEYEALGMDIDKLLSSYIFNTGGIMLLVSLLGGICTVSVGYLASRTSAGFARDIRKALFEKVESFSSTEFDQFSTASLITRTTNDVTQVQRVIFMLIRMVFYAPLIGIGGVIRAINKSAEMWWIIALAVLILLIVILIVFFVALPKFRIIQKLIDRLNLVTRENLAGMLVIRAFNKQEFELKRFDKANRDLTDVSLFVARVMVTLMPVMMLIMNGLSLGIVWVGAQQVAEANMQVGDMMAFLQYAMQIVFAFLMLSMMFIILPRASVSGDRIADVLEKDIVIKDPKQPQTFSEPFNAAVEFKNVYFRYPDADECVLHDLNFTAQPGKTTAIIGSTGCGKSTAINLIPRFFDVTRGSILVNGTDVREVRQTDLRDKIGFVPQKGTLFSGTIESNLRYADENATQETIEEAVAIAQASEFISEKPEGFASEIAQGGTNVSGGQKQRLAIARALVKQPPIYIFDDSFSALDFKTDSMLRKALNEKTSDSTVLIVTQRVATVKNADQIVVLDKGKVVGKGTHQELLKDCETYQEIAYSQLSEEELA